MSGIDLTEAVQATILDHFHAPDDRHGSWWINPGEMARAVVPLIEAQVREQIAQDIEAARRRDLRDDWDPGLLLAARIARGGAR
jgi:hypothetical protein